MDINEVPPNEPSEKLDTRIGYNNFPDDDKGSKKLKRNEFWKLRGKIATMLSEGFTQM